MRGECDRRRREGVAEPGKPGPVRLRRRPLFYPAWPAAGWWGWLVVGAVEGKRAALPWPACPPVARQPGRPTSSTPPTPPADPTDRWRPSIHRDRRSPGQPAGTSNRPRGCRRSLLRGLAWATATAGRTGDLGTVRPRYSTGALRALGASFLAVQFLQVRPPSRAGVPAARPSRVPSAGATLDPAFLRRPEMA